MRDSSGTATGREDDAVGALVDPPVTASVGDPVDAPGTASPPPLEDLDVRYSSLFVDNPYAVFSVDEEGLFVEANPAAGRLSGYDPGELLGRPFVELVVPGDLERALLAFSGALERQPQRLEVSIQDAGGRLVEIDVTAIPLVVDDQVRGIYGIAEDVTARNRTTLELEVARELAASASGVKADFISRISHEIRTPLMGIMAAAELLEDTVSDAEQRDLVTTLRRSGHRLSRLVDNVLSFASPDAPLGPDDLEEFDLHAALNDAVALAEASARSKGVAVVLDIGEEVPPRVRDHPTWTTQVLDNLLSNAVAFTDEGRITVSVSLIEGEHGGSAILYRVSDTGVGMERHEQDAVWEPFGHAASARSRARTGMGLAIVKQLVAMSGGSVGVDSAPGRGSTFSVVMPVRAL